MTSIPILSGIGAAGADFATSFPVNLVPVVKNTGISEGFLRPAEGIVTTVDAGGRGRGGTNWRGMHYRVVGNSFVSVSQTGAIATFGTIAGIGFCTFATSFNYLAINGGGKLYLFNGTTLTQVTDVDLGTSLDVEWINGYFFSTDGSVIVNSTIADPFAWNTLSYASSEASPDPILALQTIRNELYAVNQNTIEIFAAVTNPGNGFPFARVQGAQIMKGAVGSRACTVFSQTLAFVGGGENEPPGVWVASGGVAERISTREIDNALRSYTDAQLAALVMESRVDRVHEFLYVHLPDQTLVFDAAATQAAGAPVWFVLRSGALPGGYRARGFVWCFGRWNVSDPFGTKIGYLTDDVGSHYGDVALWQFSTPIIYGEGRGVIVNELELIALNGTVSTTDDPVISAEYSMDGLTWSQPRYIRAGRRGERNQRLVWSRQGQFSHWRSYRFSGDTRAHLSFARLEAQLEGMAW